MLCCIGVCVQFEYWKQQIDYLLEVEQFVCCECGLFDCVCEVECVLLMCIVVYEQVFLSDVWFVEDVLVEFVLCDVGDMVLYEQCFCFVVQWCDQWVGLVVVLVIDVYYVQCIGCEVQVVVVQLFDDEV